MTVNLHCVILILRFLAWHFAALLRQFTGATCDNTFLDALLLHRLKRFCKFILVLRVYRSNSLRLFFYLYLLRCDPISRLFHPLTQFLSNLSFQSLQLGLCLVLYLLHLVHRSLRGDSHDWN